MLRALEWGERQAVDQRADDFGAVHGLAVRGPYVFGEAIEVVDLAVEEHHRYLGPCLVVHGRAGGDRLSPETASARATEAGPVAMFGAKCRELYLAIVGST